MTAALASRRLLSEFKALSTDAPQGIVAGPVSEDDMFLWEALIEGPEGTPFEGGVFVAELKFPKVRMQELCSHALKPRILNMNDLLTNTTVGLPSPASYNDIHPAHLPPEYLPLWRRLYQHIAPTRRRPESL